ncbi:MAG TPA: 23S rRNA (pseudouridine(1915)-N(3))-methyltransferase RlmH [Burkholderiales bacterium]|nr:23S rRNA (pseudouridine(1915)-N(3))-methyltransferase RlmH [Burkholderiales bacterium]
MARLHVVALGGRLPGWAETACAEYEKRMPRGYEVSRAKALSKQKNLIALDERGKDLTTAQFAELLKTEATFVVGGPDGLDEAVKREARLLLRLSSLTLPHALAQVVLMEQLYRAATLLTGHPYHRA